MPEITRTIPADTDFGVLKAEIEAATGETITRLYPINATTMGIISANALTAGTVDAAITAHRGPKKSDPWLRASDVGSQSDHCMVVIIPGGGDLPINGAYMPIGWYIGSTPSASIVNIGSGIVAPRAGYLKSVMVVSSDALTQLDLTFRKNKDVADVETVSHAIVADTPQAFEFDPERATFAAGDMLHLFGDPIDEAWSPATLVITWTYTGGAGGVVGPAGPAGADGGGDTEVDQALYLYSATEVPAAGAYLQIAGVYSSSLAPSTDLGDPWVGMYAPRAGYLKSIHVQCGNTDSSLSLEFMTNKQHTALEAVVHPVTLGEGTLFTFDPEVAKFAAGDLRHIHADPTGAWGDSALVITWVYT